MNKREMVKAVAERAEVSATTAEAVLSAFSTQVSETLATGEPITWSGFAKFARVDRAARMGRNPQTGEAIKIAASRKVRITPLKALKDSVL